MHASSPSGTSIVEFTSQYDEYLLRVRGSAASTRQLHRHVAQRFLRHRFPDGFISWRDLDFSDCAAFVRAEFARLPSHDTQQTWLMCLRSVLRYLADAGTIPSGWDAALRRVPEEFVSAHAGSSVVAAYASSRIAPARGRQSHDR
jgi:hypothetical protein